MPRSESNPMGQFSAEVERRVGTLFGTQYERMGEQEALLYLGALIENGKEKWFAILRQENVPLPDPEGAIAHLFTYIKEEALFTDPSFAFSLRLALCYATVVAIKEQGDSKALFRCRIDEIFPEDLCERIFQLAYDNILQDQKNGKEVVPSREEIDRHFAKRRGVIISSVRQTVTRSVRHSGTDTWMEACPGCGLEKRCDHRTRRFHCKSCGFDQPYPFEPAS